MRINSVVLCIKKAFTGAETRVCDGEAGNGGVRGAGRRGGAGGGDGAGSGDGARLTGND